MVRHATEAGAVLRELDGAAAPVARAPRAPWHASQSYDELDVADHALASHARCMLATPYERPFLALRVSSLQRFCSHLRDPIIHILSIAHIQNNKLRKVRRT